MDSGLGTEVPAQVQRMMFRGAQILHKVSLMALMCPTDHIRIIRAYRFLSFRYLTDKDYGAS